MRANRDATGAHHMTVHRAACTAAMPRPSVHGHRYHAPTWDLAQPLSQLGGGTSERQLLSRLHRRGVQWPANAYSGHGRQAPARCSELQSSGSIADAWQPSPAPSQARSHPHRGCTQQPLRGWPATGKPPAHQRADGPVRSYHHGAACSLSAGSTGSSASRCPPAPSPRGGSSHAAARRA